jgi:K+-transporting ATPase ATPase C chain
METLIVAVRVTLVTLVLTGLVYPLASTGLAQLIFPHQANGSLVTDDKGREVGSSLIGQSWSKPFYFQGRPSAAGEKGYDATASSGSNFGTTSKKLRDRVEAEVARLRKENPDAPGEVPGDLVTASASGLDPHVSPEAALWQAPRVAKARGLDVERVKQVIESAVEGRELGFLGEPRVNVLELNLAIDRQFGVPTG